MQVYHVFFVHLETGVVWEDYFPAENHNVAVIKAWSAFVGDGVAEEIDDYFIKSITKFDYT